MQDIKYAAQSFIHESFSKDVSAGYPLLMKYAGYYQICTLLGNIQYEI